MTSKFYSLVWLGCVSFRVRFGCRQNWLKFEIWDLQSPYKITVGLVSLEHWSTYPGWACKTAWDGHVGWHDPDKNKHITLFTLLLDWRVLMAYLFFCGLCKRFTFGLLFDRFHVTATSFTFPNDGPAMVFVHY